MLIIINVVLHNIFVEIVMHNWVKNKKNEINVSKDALIWLKVTVNTFIMLQKISVSNK